MYVIVSLADCYALTLVLGCHEGHLASVAVKLDYYAIMPPTYEKKLAKPLSQRVGNH